MTTPQLHWLVANNYTAFNEWYKINKRAWLTQGTYHAYFSNRFVEYMDLVDESHKMYN